MEEAKSRNSSFLLPPPATGHLEGSVTMFTVRGASDTASVLSSISADSTRYDDQSELSKTPTHVTL